MPPANDHDALQRQRLQRLLIVLFLLALAMGPGPGLYLVNGYAADGGRILGLPMLYAWAVFWFLVEAGVVCVAYLKLWKDDAE